MTLALGRTKLARDLESLAKRFDHASIHSAPTPATMLIATILSRLVTLLSSWGTPAGERMALRLADMFAPIVVNVPRLAEVAARFIPGPRALELAKKVAAALADGTDPSEETIRSLVGPGLVPEDEKLVRSVTEALREGRNQDSADMEALEAALSTLGRSIENVASIHQRMRSRLVESSPSPPLV